MLRHIQRGSHLILWSVVEVIEEDAAQASPLVAVLAQEVVVRPLLKLGVVSRVVVVTHALHLSPALLSTPLRAP